LGLRYLPKADAVALATGPASQLPRVYGDTQWAKGAHKERLLDLEGADKHDAPVRFPVIGLSRCLTVPFRWVAQGAEEQEGDGDE
jgi:hypothetical protein